MGVRLAAAALMLPLAACSSAGSNDQAAPTVTVPSRSVATPTSVTEPTATPAESDVVGRKHDVGAVRDSRTVAGEMVVELDRYTVKGTSDAGLARDGVTVAPHTGELFSNQNDSRTYTVPVAPGAQVVVNECVPGADGLGMQSSIRPAAPWLRDVGPDTALLITLDDEGRATRIDTDPRCP